MDISLINPHIIKILISVREKDSISAVSKRIGLSYGWTHKWIAELIKEGILKEKWRGFTLQKSNKKYKQILQFVKNNVGEVRLYYSALNLFGISYCLYNTDAVYVWTEGRYNIARYKEFYPIFIKLKKEDYPLFKWYCKKLNLKINAKKSAFYAVQIVKDFKCVKNGEYCVESLDETIKFMKENIYNFEPALEIIDEIYNKGLKIKYKEANTM